MVHLPRARMMATAISLTAAIGCGAGAIDGEDDTPATDVVEQAFIRTNNGMRAINGLRSRNGLISVNGLSTENGLTTVNGMRALNGLRTRNGRHTRNGLSIDCANQALGESCSGDPDGLLDAERGLMSTEDGVETASYVIRCALPATDSIRVLNYEGELTTLTGELGLAPQWKDNPCDATCQERVSACLMALTNGDGAHIELELSAPFTLGIGHSSGFPYQEASFFGNVFSDPPQAYYCVGKDYASSGFQVRLLETRACEGYNLRDGSCPYVWAGYCGNAFSLDPDDQTLFGDNRCRFTSTRSFFRTGDTAVSCQDATGSDAKTWQNPITTFRNVRQ